MELFEKNKTGKQQMYIVSVLQSVIYKPNHGYPLLKNMSRHSLFLSLLTAGLSSFCSILSHFQTFIYSWWQVTSDLQVVCV